MITERQRQALLDLTRRPTRRKWLAVARAAFGPRAHFVRRDGKFVVTLKPAGGEHIVLGIGDSWPLAVEAAVDAAKAPIPESTVAAAAVVP
jgi:hypothetical protein